MPVEEAGAAFIPENVFFLHSIGCFLENRNAV
jgi:hypothetical protein